MVQKRWEAVHELVEGVYETPCHVFCAAAVEASVAAATPSWWVKVEPSHYGCGIPPQSPNHRRPCALSSLRRQHFRAREGYGKRRRRRKKKQRHYPLRTPLWVCPLNPHEWEAAPKAAEFVIAGNRNINNNTSEVWRLLMSGGIASWQS